MKHTVTTLQKMKSEGSKIAMLTCYDASFASLMNQCGVDMLLRFTGTCLTVQARKSFDPATNAYGGVATGYVE